LTKQYPPWVHRIGHASMGIISLGTVSFTLLAEPPGANDSVERQIVTEMALRVNELAGDSKAIHVNHIWYFWTQGKDPEDQRFHPVTQGSLAMAPVGSVLLWDLHYSPRLGGDVGLEYFESHREWTEVLSYRNAGENFLGKVFVKSSGEREKSYSISEAYLKNHADLPAAWSAAGNVRLRWADFSAAIPFFERASQIDAYDPDVWFGLGLAHLKLRNMPMAEKALLQARDLDAQSSSVWFHLASVHAAMDQGQRAISELTTCIQIQPDFVNAYFARGACQGRFGRLDAAVSDFSQALSLQPNHVEARFNRGATYAMMKQHDLAIADLEMALKAMPNNADGWMFLGKSHLASGNLQDACDAFTKAKLLGSLNADEPLGQYCK